MEQAERHGISSSVVFDDDYRDVASLTALIQSSNVVVLPYDSKDQVTSGVLVDAIAAGRPVVATAFPHAVELLSSGAGLVVDHDDPDAMALRPEEGPHRARAGRADGGRSVPAGAEPGMVGRGGRVPALGQSPSRRTTRIGVTRTAGSPGAELPPPPPHDGPARHVRARPVQRAEARARLLHRRHGPRARRRHSGSQDATPAVRSLAMLSLRFLQDALDSQGKCRNRMNRAGAWEDLAGLDDCWGTEHLGAGHGRVAQRRPPDTPLGASSGLERAMRQRSPWPRAMAFAALGAAEVLEPRSRQHVGPRAPAVDAADCNDADPATTRWPWPEQRLTYANATLPEAMIAAGVGARTSALLERGLGPLGVAARP